MPSAVFFTALALLLAALLTYPRRRRGRRSPAPSHPSAMCASPPPPLCSAALCPPHLAPLSLLVVSCPIPICRLSPSLSSSSRWDDRVLEEPRPALVLHVPGVDGRQGGLPAHARAGEGPPREQRTAPAGEAEGEGGAEEGERRAAAAADDHRRRPPHSAPHGLCPASPPCCPPFLLPSRLALTPPRLLCRLPCVRRPQRSDTAWIRGRETVALLCGGARSLPPSNRFPFLRLLLALRLDRPSLPPPPLLSRSPSLAPFPRLRCPPPRSLRWRAEAMARSGRARHHRRGGRAGTARKGRTTWASASGRPSATTRQRTPERTAGTERRGEGDEGRERRPPTGGPREMAGVRRRMSGGGERDRRWGRSPARRPPLHLLCPPRPPRPTPLRCPPSPRCHRRCRHPPAQRPRRRSRSPECSFARGRPGQGLCLRTCRIAADEADRRRTCESRAFVQRR